MKVGVTWLKHNEAGEPELSVLITNANKKRRAFKYLLTY